MRRPIAVRKAVPLAGLAMGALRGLATAGKAAVKNPLKTLGGMSVADKVTGGEDKVKPKSMMQTGMEMQQKRAEMQQQKNQAQMSSAQEMADKAKAGAGVAKGDYYHPSVEGYLNSPEREAGTDTYSGVSRNQEEIATENLPPVQTPAKPSSIEQPPGYTGEFPDSFYSPHAKLRLNDEYRVADEKEAEEVKQRVTDAIRPYLDEYGNFKMGSPKSIAVRTHILRDHREAKPFPQELRQKFGLGRDAGDSNGDSIIGIVHGHKHDERKPVLGTVMLRRTKYHPKHPQIFHGGSINAEKTIDNHGMSGNQIRRMKQQAGQTRNRNRNRNRNRQKLKSEPMDLVWEYLLKGSVELHHNEELPQEFIDDIMMLDRTHKMTPTNNGTLIEDIDPFMHRTIQLMAENYKEENPTVVKPRNQHLFH